MYPEIIKSLTPRLEEDSNDCNIRSLPKRKTNKPLTAIVKNASKTAIRILGRRKIEKRGPING